MYVNDYHYDLGPSARRPGAGSWRAHSAEVDMPVDVYVLMLGRGQVREDMVWDDNSFAS